MTTTLPDHDLDALAPRARSRRTVGAVLERALVVAAVIGIVAVVAAAVL